MYKTIVEAVLSHGEQCPNQMAIGFKDTRITYGQLRSQVLHMTVILQEEYKIRKKDTIMLSAVSKPEYVVMLLALQYLGAVTVPVDKSALEENIVDVYHFNNARMLFTDTRITDPSVKHHSLSRAYTAACAAAESLMDLDYSGNSVPAQAAAENDEIIEMLFTTGTTGRPKGTMLSRGNIYASTHNTWKGTGMLQSDVILLPLPLNHSVGMRVLRTALYVGASIVIQNGFAFPKELKTNMEQFHCTGFICVPAVLERLYRQMGEEFARTLKPLRYMEIGAGSLSYDMKKKIVQLLPETRIFNTWGSTETGGAIFLEVSAHPDKLTALGKPVEGVEVKVVDSDGKSIEARDLDTAGRMAIRGDMVMKGYYHLKEETESALQDGWLFTNDLVYTDEDGYVYMLGRADDIINVGGEKVSPVEVENLASEYPGFQECACIGIEDPEGILGQVPLLCYVPEAGENPSPKEILHFLSDRMESWKLPKQFLKVRELPRNRMKKLDRKKLRALWEDTKGEDLTNPVIDAILTRQSIRTFTDEAIPRPVLEQLVACAIQAPSANNMQTWRFLVIESKETIGKLKELIAETAAAKKVKFYGMNNPAAVVIITNDSRNPNGLIDASLAAENLMLAAHSLGIGSVWNNALHNIDEEPEMQAYLKELGLGRRQRVCAMLCLGYPAEQTKVIQRRQDVVTWI